MDRTVVKGLQHGIGSTTVVHRRTAPSAVTLGLLLLAACLVPVLVAGVVGTDGDDDSVRAGGGGTREAAATGFATGGAADDGDRGGAGEDGEGGGDEASEQGDGDGGRATTTTTAPPRTTAPPTTEGEPEPEPTTTAPPTTAPPDTAPPAPDPEPPAEATAADEVLALVNEAREGAGCHALTVDERLSAAALLHSQDMAARGYMDHVSPEGQDPSDRARAQGYTGAGIGENVAQGYPDAAAVMDGWMRSEGHRANIENCDYTVIGIAVATDGWYWTQMFGM